MLLKVHNPFDRAIKYHAVMMLTESDKMYKTSSCPVIAKGKSFESWSHEIFQLMLFEFKFHTKKESMKCEF